MKTKDETKHTQTPWVSYAERLFVGEIQTSISHSFGPRLSGNSAPVVGFVVARDGSHEDAAFILRACNAHDELVTALEDAEFLLRQAGKIAGPIQDSFNRSVQDARAALAKAKGER